MNCQATGTQRIRLCNYIYGGKGGLEFTTQHTSIYFSYPLSRTSQKELLDLESCFCSSQLFFWHQQKFYFGMLELWFHLHLRSWFNFTIPPHQQHYSDNNATFQFLDYFLWHIASYSLYLQLQKTRCQMFQNPQQVNPQQVANQTAACDFY